jgi:DNA polymerase-3 subunit beta
MNITFEREALIRPLTYVTGVVERRQTLPVLSYVLIRSREAGVTLTGTDLETEVVVHCEARTGDGVEMTLPARKLLDICRALPQGAKLDVRKDGSKAVIKAGRSRFTLLTLPSGDFPSIQTTQWDIKIRLDQQQLRRVLEETSFCMAQQDVRYYLNGLLLELTGQVLRAVATDGHRMAVSETVLEASVGEARQAIVPRKAVMEMIRVLDESSGSIELMLSGNHLRVQSAGLVFTAKLIDGRYPDYTKVLPARQSKRLSVNREELRIALGRAAILSNERFRGVRLGVGEQSLKIVAHNPEQEEAEEEVATDYSGEALEVGFNVNYLIEATSALQSTEVVLGLNDPNSSCLIHSPDREYPRYVIMPMRL